VFDLVPGHRKDGEAGVLSARDNEDTLQGPLRGPEAVQERGTASAVRDQAHGRGKGKGKRRKSGTFQVHRIPKTAIRIEGNTNTGSEMESGVKVKNVAKRRNVKRRSERKRSIALPDSACLNIY
jgi:hypothetical protein